MKWIVLLLGLVCTTPLSAAPSAQDIADYRALSDQDTRLATIGYRLARANAAFCKHKARNPGWVLHSYRQYPDRDIAQAAFAFPTPVAIAALVPGSAAERAGLGIGDGLSAMPDGEIWWGGELIRHRPSADLVDNINRRMNQLFQTTTPVQFRFTTTSGERLFTLDPPLVCASDFWVDARAKVDAGADGERVRVTTGMMAFAEDEDELAAIVAHELAHNLLGHRKMLNGLKKGKVKATLATEEEADRLSVWLMANAGFDPKAALRLNERYGRKYGLGIFSEGTHHRWRKRVEILQAEIEFMIRTGPKDGLRDPPLLNAYRKQQQ